MQNNQNKHSQPVNIAATALTTLTGKRPTPSAVHTLLNIAGYELTDAVVNECLTHWNDKTNQLTSAPNNFRNKLKQDLRQFAPLVWNWAQSSALVDVKCIRYQVDRLSSDLDELAQKVLQVRQELDNMASNRTQIWDTLLENPHLLESLAKIETTIDAIEINTILSNRES